MENKRKLIKTNKKTKEHKGKQRNKNKEHGGGETTTHKKKEKK